MKPSVTWMLICEPIVSVASLARLKKKLFVTLPVPVSDWVPLNVSDPPPVVPLSTSPFCTIRLDWLRSICPLTVAPSSVPPTPTTVAPARTVTPRSVPSTVTAVSPLPCRVPPTIVPLTNKPPFPCRASVAPVLVRLSARITVLSAPVLTVAVPAFAPVPWTVSEPLFCAPRLPASVQLLTLTVMPPSVLATSATIAPWITRAMLPGDLALGVEAS